jgi:hypothetical protein
MAAFSSIAAGVAAAAAVGGTVVAATGAGAPKIPKAPKYDKALREGVMAESAVLPGKVQSELAARAQFDPAVQAMNLALMGQSSKAVAGQALEVGEEFGPRQAKLLRDLVEMASPEALAVKDEIGRQVLADLKMGAELSPADRLRISQDVRGAQVARGITSGSNAAVEEALALRDEGTRLRQMRLSNAGTFLTTPSIQSMAGGLVTGYSPTPVGDSYRLFNPNAGQQAAGFAQQNYATGAAIAANTPNPWLQGLGMIAGAAGTFATAPRSSSGSGTPKLNPREPSFANDYTGTIY